MILEPDGKVGSCRNKGCEFPVGNIDAGTLDKIWNGPRLRQWRREFLDGAPRICATEVRQRACHLCPTYHSSVSQITLSEIQTRPPLRLGVNLNGRCNLRCRMCHVWKKPNGLYDLPQNRKILDELLPFIEEIELFSGEPFVQKDTFRLFRQVHEINPNCQWTLTTNGHWILNDRLRSELDRISIKSLILSLDSLVPQTYAMIRRGGRLDFVLRNLDRLREYDLQRQARGLGALNLCINFLIQKDNWMELASIHRFETEKDVPVFRTFLCEPAEFSLLSCSEEEREEILEYYFQRLEPSILARSMRVILPLIESLPRISRCEYLLRLRNLR